MLVPERPSEEAIARRTLTHVPWAAWCQDCVIGRASEAAYKRLNRETSATPVISADYSFLGLTDKPEAERMETGNACITVLVVVDAFSGCASAAAVTRKGPEPFAARVGSALS